ncbi:hypothetical protein GCM10025865_13730 [Paraoerskovia sediminicola]|uniref:Uncharacterized protein n=1 Tax=Paraoerskovia sediminicola TaxID=1138587 RepID=A0ABN6XB65_9CELL|nr:hypothetical protein [Paraoerskovia sediminicola]BDZ42074.1 hypothetical protein GCM10025865_13730 [Paraoerskovia sediminicola]
MPGAWAEVAEDGSSSSPLPAATADTLDTRLRAARAAVSAAAAAFAAPPRTPDVDPGVPDSELSLEVCPVGGSVEFFAPVSLDSAALAPADDGAAGRAALPPWAAGLPPAGWPPAGFAPVGADLTGANDGMALTGPAGDPAGLPPVPDVPFVPDDPFAPEAFAPEAGGAGGGGTAVEPLAGELLRACAPLSFALIVYASSVVPAGSSAAAAVSLGSALTSSSLTLSPSAAS